MNDTIQILELFGGIGSPRCALRNLNIPTKAKRNMRVIPESRESKATDSDFDGTDLQE